MLGDLRPCHPIQPASELLQDALLGESLQRLPGDPSSFEILSPKNTLGTQDLSDLHVAHGRDQSGTKPRQLSRCAEDLSILLASLRGCHPYAGRAAAYSATAERAYDSK